MIRTLNFAFLAITGLVCLGLYRVAEEARIAQADLRETQAAIVRSLDELKVTRLVVAHRLSTIRHADRIIVLDRGRLIAGGRPAEVRANPRVRDVYLGGMH